MRVAGVAMTDNLERVYRDENQEFAESPSSASGRLLELDIPE